MGLARPKGLHVLAMKGASSGRIAFGNCRPSKKSPFYRPPNIP